MRRVHNSRIEKSFLHVKENIIIDVNKEFENLTGYCRNEIIGKTISEINSMLRLVSQIYIENIVKCFSCYIFTKKYEPRYVTITCNRIESSEQIFYFKEKRIYRMVDILPYKMSPILDEEVGVGAFSIPSGIMLRYNKKYTEFINKKEIFIGKNFKEVLPKSDETDFEKIFNNIINTGKSFFIKEIKYKNSNKYWGESLVPLYIKGEARYIIHTVQDITDRINSRYIIEEQNQKLNAIIENTYEEIIIVDNNGDFIKVNKIARDLANVNSIKKYEEYYKSSKFSYYDGNSIMQEDLPIEKVIRGESFKDLTVEINNNSVIRYKQINGTPIYDTKGGFVAGVISMRDITDTLNNVEIKYISTQYDLLNGIIDSFGLGYLRFSYPDFKIKECNKKVYNDIIGTYSEFPTSIKGNALTSLFPENHNAIFTEFMKVVADSKTIQSMNMKVAKKGEDRTLKMVFQPLLGLDEQVIEIAVLTVDITAEVKDKEKMENVLKIQDEIYSNVSHELKTPISVIYSANQMMDIYLKNNNLEENKQKICDYNNIIKQNCYRLTKLVNNIVDLTKGNSGFLEIKLNNVNIVEVVENIVRSIKDYVRLKDLDIVFDTDVEEKIIACDSIKIERVMLNLISNAIKFSNPKGKILINVFDKGNVVEIAVKDEGIGIEKKHMEYLFQRFYQADKSLSRNAEGTGIGLSLIKKIVDLHGGNISVESEVGKGSIFKVMLPAKKTENPVIEDKTSYYNNKIEMVNIEFSDIYSIN